MKIRMHFPCNPHLAEASEREIEPTIEAIHAYLTEQEVYACEHAPETIEAACIRVHPERRTLGHVVQTIWVKGGTHAPAAFCSQHVT